MKCREATLWLYSFRPRTSWPADVVGHLQGCPACQKLQLDLRQIDDEINALTGTAGDPSAKARLLERVAQTPQIDVSSEPVPRRPLPWLRIGAYLTGAAAIFLFGWLLGRRDVEPADAAALVGQPIVREKLVDVVRDKLVPVYSSAERDLVEALVKRNAQLVQAASVKERLDVLLDMAGDCRAHVLTMIDQGPRDQVPLTIELYGQLLREGILMQVTHAHAEERADLEADVRKRLERLAASDPSATAELPRVLADQHEALEKMAADAAELVGQPIVRGPRRDRREPMPATMALVQFAIAVSSDADTVAKADLCAVCVQRLTPVMMLYLADGASPGRAETGQHFGEMIRFGVYTPLELATAKEPASEPVQEQADRIKRNTAESIAEMEKNLEKAPAAARPALERALDATKKDAGKHKEKGKGKGKGHVKKSNEPDASNKAKDKKKAAVDVPGDRVAAFQPVLWIEDDASSRKEPHRGSLRRQLRL